MGKSESGTVPYFSADSWLAETLARPVFKLAQPATAVTQPALAAEMAQLAGPEDALFFAKVPTTDVSGCLVLGRAGFAIVDTAITFSWTGTLRQPCGNVSVSFARPDQHEAIAAIAETSFRWSRFHLDPRITNSAANLIKRRWIENYLNGKRGSAVYVAEVDGSAAGFLAVIESSAGGRSFGVIDLIGVVPGLQGRGIGAALLDTFISDWRERVDELRVGTQAANIQSLRFYESTGFRIVETTYVLHAHYRNGRIFR